MGVKDEATVLLDVYVQGMIEKLENDPALKSKPIHVSAISSLEGGEKTNSEKLQEMGISYVQLVTESML